MSLFNSDEHLAEHAERQAEGVLEELVEQECALEGENIVSEGFVLPVQPPAPARPAPRRGRFLTNLLANIGFFGFSVLLGLWYTPYLIKHLGTASYGIVPLVQQIVGYMQVLVIGLNAGVGRFLTIALERGEDETANRYFNTSVFGSLVMVLLLLGPAVWAAFHAEWIIHVPEGKIIDTRWLFACAALAFLLSTLRAPFAVSAYSLNRFELVNLGSFIDRVVGVAVVVAFFCLTIPQLWMVGVSIVLGAIAACLVTVWCWRLLTPQWHLSPRYYSTSALRELLAIGGWVSITTIGGILYIGIDLLVVNRMFGPESGGRYAAVLQWSALLRNIAGVITAVFGPNMLYYYARNDIQGLVQYARRAVKLVGLMMALPIGLICGFSVPLLQTWLGPDFADLAWLMSLMTIHLSINLGVSPLFNLQTTTNHVRLPAIVTLVMGGGNLGLAIFLAGPMGWGLYGVAAAGAIALTAKNLIFTPLYAAYILRCPWYTFLREILPLTCITLGTAVCCKLAATVWDLSGWPRLVLSGAISSIAFIVLTYWLLLTRSERHLTQSLISRIGIDDHD